MQLWTRRAFAFPAPVEDSKGVLPSAPQACRAHDETDLARVPMLFNTNSFGVGAGHESFGLLLLASRLNHACGSTCLARLNGGHARRRPGARGCTTVSRPLLRKELAVQRLV